MTTDTAALQERVAEELYYEQYPEARHRSEWPDAVYPETVYEYRDLAAAVLPIIATEVQAASERAWDEGYFIGYGEGIGEIPESEVPNNPYEATEHETGDSDEHR